MTFSVSFGNRCCLRRDDCPPGVAAADIRTPTEQNKSAVTVHAISLNHVIDWERAKVIDRESNRMDQRWIREATHIRTEQGKSVS